MNILIPIGGRDKYFPEGSSVFPKPLIDIAGSPLVEHTLTCLLALNENYHFTFVVRDEDCRNFSLDNVIKIITHGKRTDIVRLKGPTQGAICSCLMAIGYLDPNEELIIANSDQVILPNLDEIIAEFRGRKLDAAVISFNSTHPRFSYICTDQAGRIIETEEKKVISHLGIAGFYYFRQSREFIEAAKQVLLNDNPIQGTFFISQALNEMILAGKVLGHHQIPSQGYFPLYSPQKIAEYEDALFANRTSNRPAERPVLVIPMAGEGHRFLRAGYTRPKPFIDVAGKPMIARVLDNLQSANFDTVLMARADHISAERDLLNSLITPSSRIRFVSVDKPTEGAACTILLGRPEINRETPLLIANCDQIVDFDCNKFIQDCTQRNLDGSILVFREDTRDPKWSYARANAVGIVIEVREKVAISNFATVGIYYFAKGAYFLDAALDMIAKNDRVNNEFYTCPVYNYMIAQGKKVGIYEIPKSAMHGIGVPEDLETYIEYLRRKKIEHVPAS